MKTIVRHMTWGGIYGERLHVRYEQGLSKDKDQTTECWDISFNTPSLRVHDPKTAIELFDKRIEELQEAKQTLLGAIKEVEGLSPLQWH